MVKKIKIQASNVAAASGLHLHKPVNEALEDIVRYNLGKKPLTEIQKSATKIDKDRQQQICCELGLNPQTSLESVVSNISFEKLSKIPELEHAVAKQHGINHGIKKERSDLDQYEKQKQAPVVSRNNIVYSSKIICGEYEFTVNGKIDGKTEEGCVVETKRRTKRLFGEIPLYEKVQLEIYMFLTDSRENGAIHIENYLEQQNVEQYLHDSELWDRIILGLEKFGDMYINYFCKSDNKNELDNN